MSNNACRIILLQGEITLVSPVDYAWARQWRWCAKHGITKDGRPYCYVRRTEMVDSANRKWRTVYLHREIAKRAGLSGRQDHADRDGCNNTRENLRPATRSQNGANRTKKPGCSSSFKWVLKQRNRWIAQIVVNGEHHYLGCYKTEIEAAAVGAAFAIFFFGDFACFD